MHSPFGSSCVRLQRPCLGAAAVSRAVTDAAPPRGTMTPVQVDAMITGTWGTAMGKMRTRTLALFDAHASPGRRAAA
eukprot:4821204-Pyramimonas_sp.AAC.1